VTDKGLIFNQPEVAPFRKKLRSAGFYSEWKGKYCDEAWALLKNQLANFRNGCQASVMADAERLKSRRLLLGNGRYWRKAAIIGLETKAVFKR
jgi:hypothetical protein